MRFVASAASDALKETILHGQVVDSWLLDRGTVSTDARGLRESEEGLFWRGIFRDGGEAAAAVARFAAREDLKVVHAWCYGPSRIPLDVSANTTVLATGAAEFTVEVFATRAAATRIERGVIVDNDGQRLLFTAPASSDAPSLRERVYDAVGQIRVAISQFSLRDYGVEFGFGLEDLRLLRVYFRDASVRQELEALVRPIVDEDCELAFVHADPGAAIALEGVLLKKGEGVGLRKYRRVNGRIRVESLELHVVEHCNLHCDQCDAMSPFNPEKQLSLAQAEAWLDFLSGHVRADIFKLMGGEPLLHPELVDLIAAVRRSGITDVIRLTTNGLLLHKMPDAFWQGLDRLTVSNYASAPMKPEHVALTRAKCAEFGVVLNLKYIDEFNGVMLTTPIRDRERVQRIYDNCWIRHRSIVVRDGRLFKCTRLAYMDDFVRTFGVALDAEDPRSFHEDEGIPLDDAFADAALAYLDDPAPLAACRYCLGASGKLIPHRQLTRKQVRERHLVPAVFYDDT